MFSAPLILTLTHSINRSTATTSYLKVRPDQPRHVVALERAHHFAVRRRSLEAVQHRGVVPSPAPVDLDAQVRHHCSVASLSDDDNGRLAIVGGSVDVRPALHEELHYRQVAIVLAFQSAVRPCVLIVSS